jgi:hypothetical protein
MEIKNNYLISVDIESVSVGFNGLEFNLIDLEDYTEYKTLDPGASSRFYINRDRLGNLHRGDKDEVDVQLTFRRHADPYTPGSCGITGTTCYNISGDVVIKVQDAERVPPPTWVLSILTLKLAVFLISIIYSWGIIKNMILFYYNL